MKSEIRDNIVILLVISTLFGLTYKSPFENVKSNLSDVYDSVLDLLNRKKIDPMKDLDDPNIDFIEFIELVNTRRIEPKKPISTITFNENIMNGKEKNFFNEKVFHFVTFMNMILKTQYNIVRVKEVVKCTDAKSNKFYTVNFDLYNEEYSFSQEVVLELVHNDKDGDDFDVFLNFIKINSFQIYEIYKKKGLVKQEKGQNIEIKKSAKVNPWILPVDAHKLDKVGIKGYPCKQENCSWNDDGVLYRGKETCKCRGKNTSYSEMKYQPYFNPTHLSLPKDKGAFRWLFSQAIGRPKFGGNI